MKQKKLTAKQALAENERLRLKNAMLTMDIRQRTANFMTQMQIFEGIFQSTLETAGTIREARSWYFDWVKDVNALDITALDHNKQIQDLVKRHGFEFDIKDHGSIVDETWS